MLGECQRTDVICRAQLPCKSIDSHGKHKNNVVVVNKYYISMLFIYLFISVDSLMMGAIVLIYSNVDFVI